MGKYYVNMTDKVLSGWGMAEGKDNKLCFICDTYDEAQIVEDNAIGRGDMKYVNICTHRPTQKPHQYYSWKTKEDYPCWYKQGYFKGGK